MWQGGGSLQSDQFTDRFNEAYQAINMTSLVLGRA